MARCRVDKAIERKEIDGFAFPLGVYPIEEMVPRPGYTVWFEAADEAGPSSGPEFGYGGGGGFAGGVDDDDEADPGEIEEWPDRYVFDIAISATRVESLTRALFALLPGRIYPILDVLGRDAFREVDPYVSYDLIGQERFADALRRYRGFFFEDGLVGFGAMSQDPFIYVFVDEHKLITVRVETPLKERVERVLAAFDLEEVEEIAGADAATHEHRAVLDTPDSRPDLLNADEILEELRDEWGLVLNIDPDKNVDDDGNDLGITGWRCLVRWDGPDVIGPPDEPSPAETDEDEGEEKPAESAQTANKEPERRYGEVLLTAGSLTAAERLAIGAVRSLLSPEDQLDGEELVLTAERMTAEEFRTINSEAEGRGEGTRVPESAGGAAGDLDLSTEAAWRVRWVE